MSHVFERLLLATEHTPQDAGAEVLAMAMARRCALPLDLVLPLVSNAEYEAVAPELAERHEAVARAHLDELRALAESQGVTLRPQVRHGSELDAEIIAQAGENRSDLLVIRRRGRRGLLARLMFGEMVGRVVARAPCSVLVAPRDARLWSRRVLLAVDPEHADPGLTQAALAVAAECSLPLLAVAVGAAPQGALDAVLALARARGVAAEAQSATGRPAETILALAQAQGADLIVVGRRGPGPSHRVWIGGTTQKIIGLAECPVLVHVPNAPVTTP
ncbi:universal stress protein [Ideonella sp. 4Y11]|uniref:Universal stress protein n=1 Tax=Ideonella aquatica TaxID=2824119 RepID=A0A941BKU6_9BURK|nr:universal stress protein [Ideonella aquatica]MBQ0960837.1 universal stress protein [Ideonella aquatica]